MNAQPAIYSQTIGGNSVFNFLKLSNTPQVTALGGINISNATNDIGIAFNNPSLLRPVMHTQANIVFNSFYGGIKNYHLQLGYHHSNLETTFALGINYFNYGNIVQTDPSGNIYGQLKPVDYVIQLSASRHYLEKWHYGSTLKFIHSNYGPYRSSGLAIDLGISYTDSIHLFRGSLIAKNMGAQVKSYTGTRADDLPFDLQAGISKRLRNAPIQFSFTAHHLHQFNIRYGADLEDSIQSSKKFTIDNLFRHFVFAGQVYIADKVELTAGFNYLRRKELNIGNAGNGINGFSMGIGVLLKKLQIRYARSYYQNNRSYHQFGLSLKLNEYFKI